ncbi:MAG: DUF2303 family protein [Rhodocyclaceae bacterium]|nr:DUF2303 family protein [Rhodocyclaceae bacterium]
MDHEKEGVRAILDAGAAAVQPIMMHGGVPFVVVPKDYKVHDLESLQIVPFRKRANVTTTDTRSFIDYTKKHGSLDQCTVYADIDAESSRFNLVAVINDHCADMPQWRDHRCQFMPAQAVEWKRWLGSNKKPVSQAEFATWLEDNLSDIASTVEGMPRGADILQMALGFEFAEDENIDTRTKMQVFERFTLGLPVFDGGASAYPLVARLKYREKDGKVTFWYELIRPDRVFKQAVKDELARIAGETGFPVIYGTP